jgi:hypothetical protein
MRLLLTAAALAAVLGGCRHDYVRVDDMALGRVVVYRNGVAYYERRATLDKDSLVIRVPRDKVNDFLKSLTVRDAKTGRTLPVGFPSPGAEYGGMVDMVIELPPHTATDLILTYITEAPAWKPSYRVVIDRAGKVRLQGWAIVDNTSGEDWKDVKVGVGSRWRRRPATARTATATPTARRSRWPTTSCRAPTATRTCRRRSGATRFRRAAPRRPAPAEAAADMRTWRPSSNRARRRART